MGAILEKLTKKNYGDIIDKEIMKPLDIDANYEKLFYGKNYVNGWFINNRNHIYHGGSFFHTITHFHLIPEKNIGIVLSVNSNFSTGDKWDIIKEFLKIID